MSRPVKTRLKLLEALDRMESGHTVVVDWFNWSRQHWPRKRASTSELRLWKLPGGAWAFPEIVTFQELAAETPACSDRPRLRTWRRLQSLRKLRSKGLLETK